MSAKFFIATMGRAPRLWLRLLLILGVLALGVAGQLRHASAADFPIDAVGRLIVDHDGVCTGFVVRSIERQAVSPSGAVVTIYENWLASAGHCIGRDLVFRQGQRSHQVEGILGYSGPGNRGHDVLVGVFFTDHPMPTLEPAFGEYPQVGDKVMLIGYGRNALMMRVGPVLGYDERGHMEIENFVSPGNSGGPVLIPGTRRVVGIGIETTLNVPRGLSPVVCQFGACPVKPPYVATHIDRLMGLVSFR